MQQDQKPGSGSSTTSGGSGSGGSGTGGYGSSGTGTSSEAGAGDQSKMGKAKEFVSEKYASASEKVKDGYSAVREKVDDIDFGEMTDQVRGFVRTNPGKALLISVGVGFVLGMLLRRSDEDDE